MNDSLTLYDEDYNNIESEDDFNSKFGDFQNLSLTASDWTVETLNGQIAKGNIDLQPSFQRRDVWDIRKKSSFIESLLLGIPVPQIVIAQKRGRRGQYTVLDGKQRLLSISGFYAGKFKLQGITTLPNLKEKDYTSLDDEWRDILDNATMRAVRLSGWQSNAVLYTIFHRLNTGSVSLNTQELRSALFPGPFTDFASKFTLNNLTLSKLFNASATNADFRMRDVELLTRYCGITRNPELFGGNLKSFLDETTERLNSFDDESTYSFYATEAISIAQLYMELYKCLDFSTNRNVPAFSLLQPDKKPRFNRAVFDALSYPASDTLVRGAISENKEAVIEALEQTLSDSRFIDACSLSTKTKASLVRRVEIWSKRLAKALHTSTKSLCIDSENIVREYTTI